MNIRFLSFVLAAGLAVSCFAGCGANTSGKTESDIVAPEFSAAERGITFGAFVAPTVNGKADGLTDEHYKKIAEAGFDYAIGLQISSGIPKIMNHAKNSGVGYIVTDWSFSAIANDSSLNTKDDYKRKIEEFFDGDDSYLGYDAYRGIFASDEPSIQTMRNLAPFAEAYNEVMKEKGLKKEMLVNLWPAFIMDNSINLSDYCDTTYRQYVDYYFENVIQYLGYVCWDFYPLMRTATGENYIRDMYYYNYELMAERCRGTDYETRIFIQSKGDWTGTRNIVGASDLRWQIYSGMAFGCKEFIYYTYSSEHGVDDYTKEDGYTLYNSVTGEYSFVYDAAKEVNSEVAAIADAYDAYEWDGVMYKNADKENDNQLFANLLHPIEKHDRLKVKDCSQDTLVGVFKAKNENATEQDAFMIVNSAEPSDDERNAVTLKFENARAVLTYRSGKRNLETLGGDGLYSFTLAPGEGLFVIPIK